MVALMTHDIPTSMSTTRVLVWDDQLMSIRVQWALDLRTQFVPEGWS